MHYVEVLVADASYHGGEPLTYHTSPPLQKGSVVTVPLRAKQVLGIVSAVVKKPSFPTKAVIDTPSLPPMPLQTLQLMHWIHAYYPSPWGVSAQLFLPRGLPTAPLAPVTEPLVNPEVPPPLTQEQRTVLHHIAGTGTYLLHGETGSGKTRIYIELAQQALEQGRSSIVLTPEIGLTSQLEREFRKVFGAQVTIIHSGLTEATRRKIWQRLLTLNKPHIVIGARSALFSPLRNVGLIVVDEAHETAYKQDQAPYYHASRVAGKLAELHKAVNIIGSATPLVSDYFLAEQKKRPILRMTRTARTQTSPQKHKVTIVDLRERNNFSRHPSFSNQLIKAVEHTLARHEQVLLFLNRRGTARVIFCERCGWQAMCPNCDLTLVYHGDNHIVRCHSCDFKAACPTSCASCKNPAIIFKTIGTKAIADAASQLFPEAKVQRFDTDNKKSERIEQHYDAIYRGNIDIIVGTQLLAKGLDLPQLGLVGVMIADTSLSFPDFSSQERTYQLLSQVLGRVGRGHRDSQAIVQTYTPDSPLLHSTLTKDWKTFYNNELRERQRFLFPPFCHILKLSCRRASPASAQAAAKKLANQIGTTHPQIIVEGPAPSFREKTQGKYQWQLILKSKSRSKLTTIIRNLPSNWSYDIDPMNLL